MKATDFGNDFIWGTATSAYQIEGAYNQAGKGLSIWDVFTEKKRKIKHGHHGKHSCNFYHNYLEDLSLMQQLGIRQFRFSISWSRILPEGTGMINQAGIDYYNRLIDSCLEKGIEPWVTLYHWDLPEALEKQGGWTNRKIVHWFSEYVAYCVKAFGDRVTHWIVLNEPLTFVGAGYFLGLHAPGRRGMKNFIPAMHHATLAQAEGGRIIKSISPDSQVGSSFSNAHIDLYDPNSTKNKQAGQRADALFNRLFLDPALGLGYPVNELTFLSKIEPYFLPEDEKTLVFDFDFLGLQVYTREVIKHSWWTPYIRAKIIPAKKRTSSYDYPPTQMNWEVYPKSIYHVLKSIGATGKKIYITENGAAFPDRIENNRIKDTLRTQYLKDHIEQVLKAKNEGVFVAGYFVWSFLDNFEWAMGYEPRFGMVHVDFKSQKRIIKDSAYWYSNFINNNSEAF